MSASETRSASPTATELRRRQDMSPATRGVARVAAEVLSQQRLVLSAPLCRTMFCPRVLPVPRHQPTCQTEFESTNQRTTPRAKPLRCARSERKRAADTRRERNSDATTCSLPPFRDEAFVTNAAMPAHKEARSQRRTSSCVYEKTQTESLKPLSNVLTGTTRPNDAAR